MSSDNVFETLNRSRLKPTAKAYYRRQGPFATFLDNRSVHIADMHCRIVPLCFPFAIQNDC